MSLLTIILNIFLPPLAVFLKHGLGTTFLISVLLTMLGWLPGVIHAFLVNGSR
ncbi:YqaE/Pmp3 family membrane protein [Antarcticibacterium arcticum]|uniref:YqaE/Pmp3 family membrane protein n=1 Tax=Antarcticibacterium arcticum TaxID=2585771 RepID=A0A5B8YGP1_9FLAO|nr:YqaE/Pmp3 family membrane protein [Antarcticibacterium arcticum]QED37040.1 YqaE/Pmp3 family membrane protein [Antarcticibacterium arcticum]